jgi:hypothetical protein
MHATTTKKNDYCFGAFAGEGHISNKKSTVERDEEKRRACVLACLLPLLQPTLAKFFKFFAERLTTYRHCV